MILSMELSKDLLDDFAEITHDKKEKLQDVTCYGTAVVQDGNEYVRLDAADSLTPATFAVRAHHGDRVMVMIKNHRATVIANITTPSMTLGILNVTDGIIVQGYLTTNEDRTAYDDQTNYGLTFSAGGIGGYGGSGKYWYLTNAGDLYASSAEIVGNITAESGYLGSKTNGFKIDQYGIYSGTDKSGTSNGYIVLANGDFARTINGTPHADLRFAIGANFGVSSSGVLYASNVDISGTVKASLGEIGGFEIDSTSIHTKGVAVTVNADNSVGLSSSTFKRTVGGSERSNLKFAIGSNFGVDSTGKLYGSNIDVSGKIDATSGTIGSGTNKIDIGAGSIHYLMTSLADTTHDGFYIGTNGIALGKGKFKVTDAGKLTATGADIGGKITATDGSIAGWQIGTSAIYRGTNATDTSFNTSGALYFGTQGLSLSDKFSVTSAGKLTATGADIGGKITASSGKIGGWEIGADGSIVKVSDSTTEAGTYQYKAYMNAPATVTPASNNAFAVQRLLHGQSSWENVFAVRYDGYLLASYGKIAGWTIGTATLSATSGGLTTGLQVPSSGTWGIVVGATSTLDLSTAPFRVTHAGKLYATGADITGTVNAGKGSIGPWSIESYGIYKNGGWISANTGAAYIGNNGLSITDKFYVTDTGALYVANGVSVSLLSNYHFLDLCKKLSSSAGYFSDTIGYIGTWHGDVGTMLYSKNELWLRSDTDQVLISANDASAVSFAANYNSSTIVLCANSVAASGALYVSGSIAISTTGRGFNLTDSSGTTYGGIYDNGDNLWIGSASSTSPHHRGPSGNTFISSGYSTTNSAGNSTIWIWVPTLSGTTWSGTSYGVLHSGNYSNYALPKTGGTLSGDLTLGSSTDTNARSVNLTNNFGTVRLHISTAGNHGLYSNIKEGWIIYCSKDTNSTNSWAYIPRSLSVSGHLASTNEVRAGGKGTGSDGKAGGIMSTAGHLYLQGASGSRIYFYYGTSTTATSQLYESASGTLRVSGDFTVDGVVRTPGTWSNTTTNSANVRVIDQYGQLQRYSSSSKRYKHDIVAITDYKKVLDIPVVTFKYNKGYISDKDQRFGLSIPGFIAEEVEKCYPIAAEMVDGKIEDWNARYIIPPMLAVEQEHERRIKELEHQINELKAEIKALKGAA